MSHLPRLMCGEKKDRVDVLLGTDDMRMRNTSESNISHQTQGREMPSLGGTVCIELWAGTRVWQGYLTAIRPTIQSFVKWSSRVNCGAFI